MRHGAYSEHACRKSGILVNYPLILGEKRMNRKMHSPTRLYRGGGSHDSIHVGDAFLLLRSAIISLMKSVV